MRIPLSLLVLLLVGAEIAVLIAVGKAVGAPATLALTVLAIISGVTLLRGAGATTLARVRSTLASGREPARDLLEGAITCVAALLLIVPGFLTDSLAVLLLIPAVRSAVWRGAIKRARAGAGKPIFRRPVRGSVIELAPGEYAATRRSEPVRDDTDELRS